MAYLAYVQVDAVTGIPCSVEPLANGPKDPAIPGLRFGFALESEYPVQWPAYPKHYGACDDSGVNPDTPGFVQFLTTEQYEEIKRLEFASRVKKARAAKFDEIASKRWQVEGGGVRISSLNGITVSPPVMIMSAKEDQDRIDTALSNMERYPQLDKISFKAANNTWVELTYDQLKFIGSLLVSHVQKCFNAECVHSKAVAALETQAEIEAYDYSAGWPPN